MLCITWLKSDSLTIFKGEEWLEGSKIFRLAPARGILWPLQIEKDPGTALGDLALNPWNVRQLDGSELTGLLNFVIARFFFALSVVAWGKLILFGNNHVRFLTSFTSSQLGDLRSSSSSSPAVLSLKSPPQPSSQSKRSSS